MEILNELAAMEKLFLALADQTRLRLLTLMSNGEVSVNLFSETLMLSQPKVSRHLAYLRSAGLVSARRHGKWIYYKIDPSISVGGTRVLNETFDWLASQELIRADCERLEQLKQRQPDVQTEFDESETTPYPVYKRDEEIEIFLL